MPPLWKIIQNTRVINKSSMPGIVYLLCSFCKWSSHQRGFLWIRLYPYAVSIYALKWKTKFVEALNCYIKKHNEHI